MLICALSACKNNPKNTGRLMSGNGNSLLSDEDSVLFTRTWKDPSVYLMDKPDDSSIATWKKICETDNSEFNSIMIPSYMKGDPMERHVTFYDLANTGSIKDPSVEDAFMLWRLNEYMPSKRNPIGETQRYELLCAQMDSLLTCDGDGSQMDYNIHSYLESEFVRIRVYEYQKRLCDSIPTSAEALNEEFSSWKEYISAADEAFDKVKMGPGFQGSGSPMAYFGFRQENMEMMSQALLPFYLTITDPKKSPKAESHSIIARSDIDVEYGRFLSSIVKTMTEEKDSEFFDPDSYYPLEEQIASLKKEQGAWQKWMDVREKVAESLDDTLRMEYENASNNIRRRKLIDLKNRYEGYGLTSEFILKILLKYNCTETELSEYNYEQAWDKALNSF